MILHCVSHLQVCKTFWDVRKGLIPIVGAAREPGTSMLIEDVACPVDKLADMMIDLIDMFQRCALWRILLRNMYAYACGSTLSVAVIRGAEEGGVLCCAVARALEASSQV